MPLKKIVLKGSKIKALYISIRNKFKEHKKATLNRVAFYN